MKLVIFGLSVSSSWGNGHATLWRGLIRALARLGHRVVFYEHDVPYYAEHRDLWDLPNGQLRLYERWEDIAGAASVDLADADVGIVTSYCPDGIAAADLILSSASALTVFYDLDTPVTLERLKAGLSVPYIGPDGLGGFDLVLSYTGGTALTQMEEYLGARRVLPLYGSVDPSVHYPVPPVDRYRADLSYLGTYAEDRQQALIRLLVDPARRLPLRFLIGGAQYPAAFPWSDNIYFVRHLPPAEHAAFYCSSRLTLNITRAAMAGMGYCPSGRLFEAAACGAPVLTDAWDGLSEFFAPGSEILVASTTDDVIGAMEMSDDELSRMARAARDRTLTEHTADRRASELVAAIESSAVEA
jgi:spore maturation protein CgeB